MGSSEVAGVDISIPEGVASLTRDFAAALEERSAALARVTKAYKKLGGHGVDDAAAIARWLESARNVTAGVPELERTRVSLLASWNEVADQGFLQLEARLRDLANGRGWRLEGQWPELYVERGVRVQMEGKTRSVTVGMKKLRSTSLHELAAALDAQVRELIPRAFSPEGFIATLVTSYDGAAGRGGGQCPILDVYRAFVSQSQSPRFWHDARAELFTSVTADQFRARLSKVLEAGATTAPDGRELRLLPPLNPKDAMFVYQPSENRFGYVGRLEFVTAAEGAAE